MTMGVHSPQGIALYQGAKCPNQYRRNKKACPESELEGNRIRKVGAQHIKAGVGEVEHPHHAENQRQSAGQHEQEQTCYQTIER